MRKKKTKKEELKEIETKEETKQEEPIIYGELVGDEDEEESNK